MDHDRNACARTLLDWILMLDHGWASRLTALMDERRYSPLQALGACVGYVLDNSLHMSIPIHPAFEPGYRPVVPQPCPVCGEIYTPLYPGMPACGKKECAALYWEIQKLGATSSLPGTVPADAPPTNSGQAQDPDVQP